MQVNLLDLEMKLPIIAALLMFTANTLGSEVKHFEGNIHSNMLDSESHQLMFHQIGQITKEVHHLHLAIPVDLSVQMQSIQDFKATVTKYLKEGTFYNNNKKLIGERSVKRLNEVIAKIETTLLPLEEHSKEKRQVGLVVGGAILGGTIGSAIALSHTPKIYKLNNEVNEIQIVNDQLLANGAKEDEDIHHLQLEIANITEFLRRAREDSPSLLQSHCSNAINNAEQVYERLLRIVESVSKNRLSPALLKKNALLDFHKQLKKSAEELGFEMHGTKPMDLYKLEASAYLRNKYTLVIVIDVPMMRKEDLIPLHKFVPFPLSISMAMKATLTPNLGEKDLIAVAWKSGEKIFKVLSSSDLLNCKNMDTTYICPESNHFETNMEESCLGSLFIQSHEGVMRNCEFYINNHKEHVFALSSQEFLIYSQDTYRTSVECEDTSYEITIGPLSHHKIPGGCVLHLQRHTLRADTYWNTTQDIVRIQWKWDIQGLFPTIAKDDIPDIISQLQSKGSQILTARDIQKWQFDNDNNPIMPAHNTYAIVTIIGVVLALPILLCLCFKFDCKSGKPVKVSSRCKRNPPVSKTVQTQFIERQLPVNPIFLGQPMHHPYQY